MNADYKYTKADMEAATRLQIWQEVMRNSTRHDAATNTTVLPNPEGCADVACRIFDKLHGGAKPKQRK